MSHLIGLRVASLVPGVIARRSGRFPEQTSLTRLHFVFPGRRAVPPF